MDFFSQDVTSLYKKQPQVHVTMRAHSVSMAQVKHDRCKDSWHFDTRAAALMVCNLMGYGRILEVKMCCILTHATIVTFFRLGTN